MVLEDCRKHTIRYTYKNGHFFALWCSETKDTGLVAGMLIPGQVCCNESRSLREILNEIASEHLPGINAIEVIASVAS